MLTYVKEKFRKMPYREKIEEKFFEIAFGLVCGYLGNIFLNS